MTKVWNAEFSKDLVVAKAKSLKVWTAVGYEPSLGRFDCGVWLPEHSYAERVIRYLTDKCIATLGPKNVPKQGELYALAIDEYFNMADSTLMRVTKTKIRLSGKHREPQVKDFEETIRSLIENGAVPTNEASE